MVFMRPFYLIIRFTTRPMTYGDAAFALWRRRSAITWDLDLNILIKANITVTKPLSATERADLPGKILRRI